MVLIAAASLSMLLLSEVMAAPLAAIFVGYDAGLLDMTVHAYSIYAVSFLFCGFSIFRQSASPSFAWLLRGSVDLAGISKTVFSDKSG